MTKKGAPTWKQVKKFCEKDGWDKREGHHTFYRKRMPDGYLKRVKVSHGTGTIPKGRWNHILKRQLEVSEEDFWNIVGG